MSEILTIPKEDFENITLNIDSSLGEIKTKINKLFESFSPVTIEEIPVTEEIVFTLPHERNLLCCPQCEDNKIELLSDSRILKAVEVDYARCVICNWHGTIKELKQIK